MTTNNQQTSQRVVGDSSAAAITFAMLVILLLVGCDSAQDSIVCGQVTLDGEPLDHGSILFTNAVGIASKPASGNIQSDGSYLVQIGQSGEMVAGEYSVGVSMRAPSIPSPEGGPPTPGELLTPAQYASTSTSGLRYQVRAGKNTIDIALSGEEAEPTEDAATETDSEKETTTVEIAEVDESETGDSEATIE